MSKFKPMFSCDLCGSDFQMGAGRYEGGSVSRYQMWLCKPCYSMNHDGFAPQYDPIIEKHLAERGIPLPARNSKGFYPR